VKTLLLPITAPEEELFGRLKKELRKNIRKGDSELAMEAETPENYFTALRQFRKSKGLSTPRDWVEMNRELFIAKFGGKPVCGQGIYFEQNEDQSGVVTKRGIEAVLWRTPDCPYYASDWLKWKLILYAKQKGCEYYDFAGNNGYYKKKWGGFEFDDGRPEKKSHSLAPVRRFLIKTGLMGD
jgi:hypothetical protein